MAKERNIFELAARCKLRFPIRGSIGTEDLWDLSLENLSAGYQTVSKALKGMEEDSLMAKSETSEAALANLRAEIIKHVFTVKKEEADAKTQAAVRREQLRQLDDIIARKQNAELEGLSVEDLAKKREELAASG